MDALTLSRIQFGVSVGFHYLLPTTTLGLTLFIVIFETLFIRTKKEHFKAASSFLVKILGLIFTIGVATGLLLPFAFGANWARFSAFAGAIFGTALSIEATTAFAFESAFLAIVIFGRNRVSPFIYWLSTICIFLGSHLSGLLIVSANSWLQTPGGFAIENGRIVMTSFFKAFINDSTIIRYIHVVTGAWLTGTFFVLAIAAYFSLKKIHTVFTAAVFKIALPIALVAAALQPLIGHAHIMNVLEHNPEKEAAYEGIFYSVDGAPLYSFGIPDEKNNLIRFGIGIPYGLSLLESGNPKSHVKGLLEYPKENRPPVNVIFTTFHLMVMFGMIMLCIAALGVFLLWKKKLAHSPWYLAILPCAVPIPYAANELGWIGAEMGRQPWMIYNVMRTTQASSIHLPAWQIALTLGGICTVYAFLFIITLFFLRRIIRLGPKEV